MNYKESKSIAGELLGYWREDGTYALPTEPFLADGSLKPGVQITPMSQSEIDANRNLVSQLETEKLATEYQRQRSAEYPPIADYLDGVVKNDQTQINAYIAACQAVKAKYPKPTGA